MPIEFCRQCQNMLYMSFRSEDGRPELIYHCKQCLFEESATTMRAGTGHKVVAPIHTENYEDDQASYKQFVNDYIREDSTLPHISDIECPNTKCSRPPKAMNDVLLVKYDVVNLKYLYHCTYCSTFWKTNSNSTGTETISTKN
jgi:DNA-directed RNA polymerase subunit M/transcription elongation factor TFIIS